MSNPSNQLNFDNQAQQALTSMQTALQTAMDNQNPSTTDLLKMQQQMETFSLFVSTISNTLKQQSDMLSMVSHNLH